MNTLFGFLSRALGYGSRHAAPATHEAPAAGPRLRHGLWFAFLSLSLLPGLSGSAFAAGWSDSALINNPVCTAANDQYDPQIAADAAGGAIITWRDNRNGTNNDIYAQRYDAAGAPQWTADGIAVCTAGSDQSNPQIAADAAGGAIITWQDFRSGTTPDIYAQRVNAAGAPQWTANGIAVSTAANWQDQPQIVVDAAGGAFITWQDYRNGTNYDIYAQRINAAGAPQWTADGIAVSTAAVSQESPQIAADAAGGGIITWQDYRSGEADVYAQRVNAAGAPQWTADGVAVSTAANQQYSSQIATDGAGGAIITWYDYRSGTNYDIYTQRINAAGAPQWTADGIAVCAAANQQYSPQIAADAAGGGIITWQDYRSGTADIYAQRVDAAGAAQWTADGIAVCAAADSQDYPQIAADAAGGAIITWRDYRSGFTPDIYAQRVNAAGASQWAANGIAVSTAAGYQDNPNIVADASGAAIITWQDYRSGTNNDIYAQHISGGGILPVTMSAFTAE
ncbi:MAG: hypothetical protein ACR2IE_06690 [Candidatus Sumerlaeaceae bacterium]